MMISGEHALWNAGIAHLRHEQHLRWLDEWAEERRLLYRLDMHFGATRNRMAIITGLTS